MWKANTIPLFLRKTIYQPKLFSSGSPAVLTTNTENNSNEVPGLDINNYERIKIVGQGSFGIAILYKSKADSTQVVFKQINLINLTQSEKELAMNEVEVFSKLHHPNIISYLGSFIKENTLLIEMEYADGGTLAQVIGERKLREFFAERYIITIFEQIASAINYMHSENILHRDLKTANIFLTKRGIVKVGDFGISKVMNKKILAQTVLGTPFYFSPEMCEGKDYDHKSDIWAIGCILGELCCLRKSFSATNLSELVAKIMTAKYNPIPAAYSNGLKSLINNLLQVDIHRRPEASEILEYWLPLVYRNLGKHRGYCYEHELDLSDYTHATHALATAEAATKKLMEADTVAPDESIEKRSVLYQLKAFGTSFTLTPIQLPSKACINCVATNSNGSHFIVVNNDGSVYAWGESSKGQLGLNSLETWKHYPNRIESLRKYHIVGACSGEGFTIVWTSFGVVLSFGDNSKHGLGHLDNKIFHSPKIIEKLENMRIIQVAAGLDHAIALSDDGSIFTWGTSTTGALGMGSLHTRQKLPHNIMISHIKSKPIRVICGPDTSAILFENGDFYVCGSNEFNKLGFSTKVHKIMAFKKVNLKKKIIDAAMSLTHSVFLVESGYVFTIGKNTDGQRGIGNNNLIDRPTLVTGIKEKFITNVKCSNLYTIVSSDDNVISFWGTRYGIPDSNQSTNLYDNNATTNGNSSKFDFDMGNTTAFTNFLTSVSMSTETILDPIDIIALYSSKAQLKKGYYVQINNIYTLPHSILVLVDTTTPLVTSIDDVLT